MSSLDGIAGGLILLTVAGGIATQVDFEEITNWTREVAYSYTNKAWDNCEAVQQAAASFSDFQCVDADGNGRPADNYLDDIGTKEWVKDNTGLTVEEAGNE